MNFRTGTAAGQRQMALWLAVALFPMLSFVGHWPSHVDIPGTDLYLTVPFAAPVEQSAEGHSHGQHCHEDASGCSKTPTTAGVGFALMNESLAVLGAAALLIAVALRGRILSAPQGVIPELRPPRASFA